MNKRQKKSYWKFWWEQVLKGIIPECVYRMARVRSLYKDKTCESCRYRDTDFRYEPKYADCQKFDNFDDNYQLEEIKEAILKETSAFISVDSLWHPAELVTHKDFYCAFWEAKG